MDPGVRPLGIGEILDAAMKVFTRHWRTLALCVLAVVAPVQIVTVAVTAAADPDALRGDTTELTGTQGAIAVVALVSGLLAAAACSQAVAEAVAGRAPDWRSSLREVGARLGDILWLAIVLTLGIVVGFLLFVVPGIWLAVAWSVAVPAMLLERLGAFPALTRSFRLVQGRWWATFGLLLLGVVLVGLLGTIVQGVLLSIPEALEVDAVAVDAVANVIATMVGALLTMPFGAAVIVIAYFDLRLRKEGRHAEPDRAPEPQAPIAPEAPGGWLPPRAG